MKRIKISAQVAICPKGTIFKNGNFLDPIYLSKMFLKQKNKKNIQTKTINDLALNDFITFQVIDGEVTAKLFGVFKVVPNDVFILEECLITEDIPKGFIYQVQKDAQGNLFLQGIKKGFNY